jgi:hypothetical protein
LDPDSTKVEMSGEIHNGDEKRCFSARVYPVKLSGELLHVALLVSAARRRGTAHIFFHHHHQPINVPTAGAKAFLMDYS